jgi:transcriptional regulator
MAFRRDLLQLLSDGPRSVSSLARELHLSRRDIEEDLRHLIRSVQAAGHQLIVIPARCRTCGFTFDSQKLMKPGKCPGCRASRIYEPRIQIDQASRSAGSKSPVEDDPAPR